MTMKKYISYQEAMAKLKHYCSYQERSHHDVRYKLISLGIRGEDLEEIISHLVQENYLDETRYAKTYARGKMRMNGWGWQKIRISLKQKGISEYNLGKARDEITQDENYKGILQGLLKKKNLQLKNQEVRERKNKLFRFAYGRGFEADLISEVLSELLSSQ